jgi:hypothetical protein
MSCTAAVILLTARVEPRHGIGDMVDALGDRLQIGHDLADGGLTLLGLACGGTGQIEHRLHFLVDTCQIPLAGGQVGEQVGAVERLSPFEQAVASMRAFQFGAFGAQLLALFQCLLEVARPVRVESLSQGFEARRGLTGRRLEIDLQTVQEVVDPPAETGDLVLALEMGDARCELAASGFLDHPNQAGQG